MTLEIFLTRFLFCQFQRIGIWRLVRSTWMTTPYSNARSRTSHSSQGKPLWRFGCRRKNLESLTDQSSRWQFFSFQASAFNCLFFYLFSRQNHNGIWTFNRFDCEIWVEPRYTTRCHPFLIHFLCPVAFRRGHKFSMTLILHISKMQSFDHNRK